MKPVKILLLGLLGLVVVQVILWWQDSASPVLAAVLTVAAGAVPLVIEFVKATHAPAPDRRYQAGSTPRRARSGGIVTGVVVGLLVLLLIGGLAYGATYAIGLVTGRETGVQRLTAPVTGKAGALRVDIEQVEVGRHFTQVRLTATNSADFTVRIPLFGNCQLLEPKRTALAAKTGFTTTSVIDVPPGSVPVTTEVVFNGTPSDGRTSLTLTCSTLFWQGFDQPDSLQVKRIALKAT